MTENSKLSKLLYVHRDFICLRCLVDETLLAHVVVFNGTVCPSNPNLTTALYVLFKKVRALNKAKEWERINRDPGALLSAVSGSQRVFPVMPPG